jgi:HSP20 family protein
LVPWKAQLPQFFGNFEREVENLFEHFFATRNAALGIQAFAPRTTVAETDDGYDVEVDLPGMKPEDVQVEMGAMSCGLPASASRRKRRGARTITASSRSTDASSA